MDTLDFGPDTVILRICTRCGEARPLSMFYIEMERRSAHLRNGSKRRHNCRICQQELNRSQRKPRQDVADQIKIESGCTDCGLVMPDHPEVFEFDHLPQFEKTKTVSELMVIGPLEAMLDEIAKCEVVCANCHRIRTRSRGSNYLGGGWSKHGC